jgi:hypothetical protein
LWIPVRSSASKQTPLKNYQAIVDPSRPLAGIPKAKRDQAWVEICEKIQLAVNSPDALREPPQSFAGPYPAFLDDQPVRISVCESYSAMVSEQRLSELIELATTDPRAAIQESWSELGSAILGAANVQNGYTDPTSADVLVESQAARARRSVFTHIDTVNS